MTDGRSVSRRPRVVFVCVRNGGKSQMAAGLMRQVAGDAVEVDSAGTHPGTEINGLSAQVLQEIGVDITDQVPKALTPDMVATADLVVTLGREAVVEPGGGTAIVKWDTDEPSEQGIEGIERTRLVRDDIAARVDTLAAELDSPARLRTRRSLLPTLMQESQDVRDGYH